MMLDEIIHCFDSKFEATPAPAGILTAKLQNKTETTQAWAQMQDAEFGGSDTDMAEVPFVRVNCQLQQAGAL